MKTEPDESQTPSSERAGARRNATAAVVLAVGLAALAAQAAESGVVQDIQRYCTACWKNARLDPSVWEDCTQEVCCRLLAKARSGQLDLTQVLEVDTPERRELVRAIDTIRKRVQRTKRFQPLDEGHPVAVSGETPPAERIELGELLESARAAVLSQRQDRIVDLWTHGWTVPEIAQALHMPAARVSDEKYKAIRKLERYLAQRHDDLDSRAPEPGQTIRRVG
jgi:RNA polymerase sigma factor (sigma-70 family)